MATGNGALSFGTAAGQGGLRVFNAVSAGTSYDVCVGLPGSAIVSSYANNIGFGMGSSYFNVGADAAQQVRIISAGTQTLVLDVGTRSFIAGQNLTLVVAPPATGTTTPRAFYVTGAREPIEHEAPIAFAIGASAST